MSITYNFNITVAQRGNMDLRPTDMFDVIISPDDGTKKMLLSGLNLLDVNWYLCKIIPALTNENMWVEGFSYTQF